MTLFEWVKNQVSIHAIIGGYVRLNRAGTYWKGCCPFHNETTPSFTVSPDKQIFYCFGCHAGGDVVAFIAKVESLDPSQALNHIIENNGLEIPPQLRGKLTDDGQTIKRRRRYTDVCREIKMWMNSKLLSSNLAMSYLIDRKIKKEAIEHFSIGYVPGGLDSMNSFANEMVRKGFLREDLVEAGFLQKAGHMFRSPYEERIVFPIHDILGRCVGFGGRVFRQGDTRAKYYNSRESDFFHKRKLLFGLDLAKNAMQKSSTAFVVEGYVDCVAMVDAGYEETVAVLGTAFTHEHLEVLARFVKRIYVVYDGDKAGQVASLKLAEMCWDVNVDLFVVRIPGGQDPASFLQNGGDIKPLITHAPDIFTFFVKTLGETFFEQALSDKLAISKKMAEVLGKIKDYFKRDLLIAQAAQALQVPFDSFKGLVKKHQAQSENGEQDDQVAEEQGGNLNKISDDSTQILEERLFSAILSMGSDDALLEIFDEDVINCISPKIRNLLFLWKKICSEENREKTAFDRFIDAVEDSQRSWVLKCCVEGEQSDSSQNIKQILSRLCRLHWRQEVVRLKSDIEKARHENDHGRLGELLESFTLLRRKMQIKGLI